LSAELVASLRLKFEDDASSGIRENRELFTGLNQTIQELNETLVGLNEMLASLHGPEQLVSEFRAAQTEGAAAADSIVADFGKIDAAVETSTTWISEYLDYMGELNTMAAEMHLPSPAPMAPGGGGGGEPPIVPPVQPPPQPPNDDEDGGKKLSKGPLEWMTALIGGMFGVEAWKNGWNSFDQAALQISIAEGLSGHAAQSKADDLMNRMTNLAFLTRNDAPDLLKAYQFLVTDSLTDDQVHSMMPGLATASTAYNVPVDEVDQAAFTLVKNFKIDPSQIGNALAILHHATMREGHFSMEDFSMFLPQIGGQMELMGMSGMQADIVAASALETIRKNTGTSGEAATDLQDLLFYLHSPMGMRMFDRSKRMEDLLGPSGKALLEKYHIEPLDLPKFLNEERSRGVDPINAMTDYFSKILAGVSSPTDRAFIVGAYMHNQAAQSAILDLVQYQKDFKQYQVDLSGVSDVTLQQDFATAIQGSVGQLRNFESGLTALNQAFGFLAGKAFGSGLQMPTIVIPSGPGMPNAPAPTPPPELHFHVFGRGIEIVPAPTPHAPAAPRGQVLNRN
jgi:hypothetical protein